MKNNVFRRWRNSRDKVDYLSYARARNQARSACRKAVRLSEKDIASQIKENPKHFWRYVKSKVKVRPGMGCIIWNEKMAYSQKQALTRLSTYLFLQKRI